MSVAPSASAIRDRMPAVHALADYVARLRYEDLPAAVIDRAKQCLADAVACALFGSHVHGSNIALDVARSTGSGGPCQLPGLPGTSLHPPQAAFALGVFAHAFELDSLRKPGAGVHPGATVALPALAMAQALDSDGRALVTAVVAGCEVLFRVGKATLHSAETLGFHAPGITGPFGSAAACASLMGLPPARTVSAFGLCGSMGGGLLAFIKAGSGMVKRLHLGRAAEAGVLAAMLAQRGYEGPPTVLDGRYGVLDSYCRESDPALLTEGLGTSFELHRLCIKKYACHVTSQAPVELMRELIAAHGFAGEAIDAIEVEASEKVVSHHANPEPADLPLAQYSLPFNIALSTFFDPIDPRVYSDAVLADRRVRALAGRVRIVPGAEKGWGVRMAVRLASGGIFAGAREVFTGCPEKPFGIAELRTKFERLVRDGSPAARAALFDRLMAVDDVDSVAELPLA